MNEKEAEDGRLKNNCQSNIRYQITSLQTLIKTQLLCH